MIPSLLSTFAQHNKIHKANLAAIEAFWAARIRFDKNSIFFTLNWTHHQIQIASIPHQNQNYAFEFLHNSNFIFVTKVTFRIESQSLSGRWYFDSKVVYYFNGIYFHFLKSSFIQKQSFDTKNIFWLEKSRFLTIFYNSKISSIRDKAFRLENKVSCENKFFDSKFGNSWMPFHI